MDWMWCAFSPMPASKLLYFPARRMRLGRRPRPFASFPLERSAFLEALGCTRAVVASAGSQLISECAASGIPLFALHAANDDEQRINVALVKAAGIGDGTSFEAFEPVRLIEFFEGAPFRRSTRSSYTGA